MSAEGDLDSSFIDLQRESGRCLHLAQLERERERECEMHFAHPFSAIGERRRRRRKMTLESKCEEKTACMQLTILAIFSFQVDDLTEKQSGSKRCEFQGWFKTVHPVWSEVTGLVGSTCRK